MPMGPPKGFSPKNPLIHSKGAPCYLTSYFDWNSAGVPISARFSRNNGSNFQDLSFMRRPKKPVRPMYPNDRFHWARNHLHIRSQFLNHRAVGETEFDPFYILINKSQAKTIVTCVQDVLSVLLGNGVPFPALHVTD
ncbi:uncharacterized protein TNIN_476751 [Trichonephila inaurata madagascariensis]|uniref:Uncharacterized protein n=1 Tax=Trichonephila inaurata madagascariensis TaxID=2747483 RepID=A0A8X6XPS3_9ARAC|nr:uncharacterized protein TNIN_476751 [Trichonephila inaurata madagascariensis]